MVQSLIAKIRTRRPEVDAGSRLIVNGANFKAQSSQAEIMVLESLELSPGRPYSLISSEEKRLLLSLSPKARKAKSASSSQKEDQDPKARFGSNLSLKFKFS